MSDIVVLISCMNKDKSIIEESNIQTDVIVVNQTDGDSEEVFFFENKKGRECKATIINSTTRGLSRSRNIAIKKALGWKYGILCDDDEMFEDDYEDKILKAYSECSADFISFIVKRTGKSHPELLSKMSFGMVLKTSSVQITFNIPIIFEKGILFDEQMGAGTGNGSGEEVQFMMQCRRASLKMYYYPYQIAVLKDDGDSTWFAGFTDMYFQNRGWAARRTFGLICGSAFMLYNIIHNRKKFVNNGMTISQILTNSIKGIISKR